MSQLKRSLLLLTLMLLVGSLAHAQDDAPHPLLDLLARTPNGAEFVSYTDYAAMERGGLEPLNVQNFQEDVLDGPQQDLWIGRSFRLRTGLQLSFLFSAGEMPDVMGFDFLAVDRALLFNLPPDQGIILQGAFDEAAVEAAYAARDYMPTEIGGQAIWCVSAACDQGVDVDPVNRNPANLFDPALGRRPPLIVQEDTLLSAFALPQVEALAAIAQGNSDTLLDNPPHAALAAALTDPQRYPADLVQVQFFGQAEVDGTTLDLTQFESRAAYEESAATVFLPAPETFAGYGALPPFTHAALSDYHDGSEQVATLALVYADADLAQQAAAELQTRFRSFNPGEIYTDLDAVGIAFNPPAATVYTDATTGLSVALVRLTYAFADETDPTITIPTSGIVFVRWMDAFVQRELFPIWQVQLPDWLSDTTDE